MGILNVTPDSFSDGGEYQSLEGALAQAQRMIDEGAHILDIGGESTRPGADEVSVDEELSRVLPVIEHLREHTEVALSIDTSKPEVAGEALQRGVDIVNDVSGFRSAQMIGVCRQYSCGLVAMHMKGVPRTMQDEPHYHDVVQDVREYFRETLRTLEEDGIAAERITFDPGIGFGKALEHNLSLLKGVPELMAEGRPLVMGVSRKSLIAALLGDDDLAAREFPTVALTAYTRAQGACIHRVHAVKENLQALRMIEAIKD